jgi:hypothetical protein
MPPPVPPGNHDAQSTLSRKDVFKVLSSLPGSISQPGPSTLHGYGNYYITIANASGHDAMHLYLLDTGSDSEYSQISGYDWAWPDQVAWYLHTSQQLKVKNGNATLPAVAFFHICTPEYWEALDAHVPLSGDNFERGGCSAANSGLFTAFLEQGDVKMVNVGHVSSTCFLFDSFSSTPFPSCTINQSIHRTTSTTTVRTGRELTYATAAAAASVTARTARWAGRGGRASSSSDRSVGEGGISIRCTHPLYPSAVPLRCTPPLYPSVALMTILAVAAYPTILRMNGCALPMYV